MPKKQNVHTLTVSLLRFVYIIFQRLTQSPGIEIRWSFHRRQRLATALLTIHISYQDTPNTFQPLPFLQPTFPWGVFPALSRSFWKRRLMFSSWRNGSTLSWSFSAATAVMNFSYLVDWILSLGEGKDSSFGPKILGGGEEHVI